MAARTTGPVTDPPTTQQAYQPCKGQPAHIGDIDHLPTGRELSFNIVKLSERHAQKYLLDKHRVTLDGTWVCIDGQRVYDRVWAPAAQAPEA